ncbi:hypothetical protein [Streptomyces coerulescens]|uniref:Secreted protein n=1 Tax=Streptomyces coerulescens TaxID=29304 RepID=A0ABW0CKK5_STRCD
MSWTRTQLAASAVCVLLLTGSAGCGSGDARDGVVSSSPVGKVLDDTDDDGRHYREVDKDEAPEVAIEVQPDPDADSGSGEAGTGGGWDVTLTLRGFRFSPAGAEARAVAGRGLAYLFVDGRLVTRLRTPGYRLPADLVPRGTHQVTVRLYADDGTVWAVDGDPVESTADVTASESETGSESGSESGSGSGSGSGTGVGTETERETETTATPTASASSPSAALSAPGTRLRTGGQGSPDRAGKAS